MLPGKLSVPRTYIKKHPERSYDASVYETKPPHFIEEIRTSSKILKKKKKAIDPFVVYSFTVN